MNQETEVTVIGDEPVFTVRKESQQATPGRRLRWAEPRISFDDLLYFFDVNVWHRRCVLVKSLLVGGLGWHLEMGGEVVLDPARGINRHPGHPLVRLLLQPNGNVTDTFDQLVARMLTDFYAVGNGYLEVGRNRRGEVAELFHVPGRTMRRDAGFRGYWQVRESRQIPFASFGDQSGKNEVLHLLQYDPSSDYYGVPDWYAALGAMGLDRTVLEFNTRIFANSLMAHMAVVVEGGKLGAPAKDALRTFLTERATGTANAGRVLLLEDERTQTKIRFERLNLETKDLLIVDAQRYLRDMVIAAHGVPPRVLGIVTAGQLGASGEVEGQLRTFRETVLRPGRRLLETLLGQLVTSLEPTARLRFHEIDVTDTRADGEFYTRMLEAGVLTPEEVRGKVVDGGW